MPAGSFALRFEKVNETGVPCGDYHEACHHDPHEPKHVFPRARLTVTVLKKAGLTDSTVAKAGEKVNRLGNLQLLEGPKNLEKSDKPPLPRLTEQFPSVENRAAYAALYDLDSLADNPADFMSFYAKRRDSLQRRLIKILGIPQTRPSDLSGNDEA